MPNHYKYKKNAPTKAELVRQAFRDNPNANVRNIAKRYNMQEKNVYPYRNEARAELAAAQKAKAAEETNTIHVDAADVMALIPEMKPKEFNDLVHQITRGRGGSEPEPTPEPYTDVDGLLDLRAAKYGRFVDVAATTQEIMQLVGQPLVARGVMLGHDQATSLYMIALKLARIANGDPNEVDNWLDIAGYATLVAERLSGKEPR